jgi:DNA-binding NarL/FixJ family response regulator
VWAEVARSLKLSARELQITHGVFDNLKDGAIAAKLGISEHTVHVHLNRLYRKLRVSTRVELVLRVVREFLFLILSGTRGLAPICSHHCNGGCPLHH